RANVQRSSIQRENADELRTNFHVTADTHKREFHGIQSAAFERTGDVRFTEIERKVIGSYYRARQSLAGDSQAHLLEFLFASLGNLHRHVGYAGGRRFEASLAEIEYVETPGVEVL